jgi:hypothetical protein
MSCKYLVLQTLDTTKSVAAVQELGSRAGDIMSSLDDVTIWPKRELPIH